MKLFNKKNYTKTTPIQEHGGYLVKRDDLFTINGISGGKVRGCWRLSAGAGGLITASSRSSPQAVIVARVGQKLGIPTRLHMPEGQETEEMVLAKAAGGEIIQHKAGYNNVIIARAESDLQENSNSNWVHVPFGMESRKCVAGTAKEVESLLPYADKIKRIVVPVGSGMSLAGIMNGMKDYGLSHIPILGVAVGSPSWSQRLTKFAPPLYKAFFKIKVINAGLDYHTPCDSKLGQLPLDPIYEAKCVKFLQEGDLLWVVGIRPSIVDEFFNNNEK